MKEFDLNIEKILDNWSVADALREIIANALDEQVLTNSKDIQIVKTNYKEWHIIDYGRGLSYHHLTQNENIEKLSNDKLIGRFGVGLKDALATLYRNNVDVQIFSKFGTITLKLASKSGFDDILTLHAIIENPVNPSMIGTDFCIKGIKDEDMELAQSLFLKFSNQQIFETTNYGQIVSKNNNKSYIYVNGVKIAEEENFLFSYNITSLTTKLKKSLNRERSNVGRSAYTDRVKNILLACSSEKVINLFIDNLGSYVDENTCDELKWQDVQEYILQQINSDNIVFVSPEDLKEEKSTIKDLESREIRTVVLSQSMIDKLNSKNNDEPEKSFRTLSEYKKEEMENFSPAIVEIETLSKDERNIYDRCNEIVNLIGYKDDPVKGIYIVERFYNLDSIDNGINGLCHNDKIYIRRLCLNNIKRFAGVLLHELAHFNTGFSDGTRDFENELTEYIGQLTGYIIGK